MSSILSSISYHLEPLVQQLSQADPNINSWKELRLLISFIQNRSYTEVFFDPLLSEQELIHLNSFVQRRCKGEPLAKITGQKEFWSLNFKVTKDTLDPRPDSETIIQAILNHFCNKNGALNIIDFGTGSGCLLLSTLSEYSQAWGVGIDISETALKVAQENASSLNLAQRSSFIRSDWAISLKGKFDILISNPPYIGFKENLDKAVKDYDPFQALYGGEEGLEAYKILLPQLLDLMYESSLAFVEIGQGQSEAVKQIGNNNSLLNYSSYYDLGGIERVLVFKRKI